MRGGRAAAAGAQYAAGGGVMSIPMDNGESDIDAMAAVQTLMAILSPHMVEEVEKLKSGQSELVHYTTAENALNLIKSQRFWLRNVRCMNDYSEVENGIDLLVRAFGGPENERIIRLYAALDQVSPGEAKTGVDAFNEWIPRLPDNTFIGCLSQADTSEVTGRLSMWRAYSAPSAGVALILDKTPFIAETDALKAYSVPVAYLTAEQFLTGIDNCLTALEQFAPSLKGLQENIISNTVFWWLLMMAVSLKHPAFHEEREWRIVYFPEMFKSEVIEECVETVRGIPQVIQKIPLIDDPERGLHGASPEKLLKKLIVGPSEFPGVIRDALAAQLSVSGVTDPLDRISISSIPLR
jgi:Protein of unknown function (DUF2971)